MSRAALSPQSVASTLPLALSVPFRTPDCVWVAAPQGTLKQLGLPPATTEEEARRIVAAREAEREAEEAEAAEQERQRVAEEEAEKERLAAIPQRYTVSEEGGVIVRAGIGPTAAIRGILPHGEALVAIESRGTDGIDQRVRFNWNGSDDNWVSQM